MKVFIASRLPNTANSWFTGGHLLGSFTGPSVTGGKVELDTEREMIGTLVIIQMATNYINLAEIEVFVGSSDGAEPSSCSYPAGHTMTIYPGPSRKCLRESISSGLDQASRDAIVRVHNELRNKVALGKETSGSQPSAADMRKMVWDDEVAKIAQRWADQCHFGHDRERNLCDGTYAGQNAYISSSSAELSPYSAVSDCENAVTAWYNEVKKPGFNHGHISPFRFDHGTGHYTQVVWSESDRVGCGLRYYKEGGWFQTLIICNYAVGGNMIGARMYKEGAPCSQCPSGRSCDTTYRGLCA